VAKLIGPKPRELVPPLTEGVEDFATSVLQGITHSQKSLLWGNSVGIKPSTVIILEVVHSPGGIGIRIEFFIAIAAWEEPTVIDPCITKSRIRERVP
jgi:hypothetical protein